LAGFGSGLVIQWISPQTITTWIGDDVVGIVVAASVGIAINVPLMFEIPLVAAMLLAGMGTAPAGSLLFTAAAGGPITFWGLAKVMPRRGILTLGISTWILGIVGGLVLLLVTSILEEEREFSFRANYTNQNSDATVRLPPPPRIPEVVGEPESSPASDLIPSSDAVTQNIVIGADSLENEPIPIGELEAFQNIVVNGLLDGYSHLSNDLPGVVIFDFDRDGDQDLFFTQDEGNPNLFFENDGDGSFLEKASLMGLSSHVSAATGAVACDLDNDGYQDLYVSAQGRIGDGKNYLNAASEPELKAVHMDRLFRNKTDGTFEDVTENAFGDAVNLRTGSSIGCADVNNDGLNDLYVANREDLDAFHVDNPSQGNLNVMYLNKGELKFDEVAKEAGVMGELTVTWAVLFYDFDDDMDVDLWTAEDGGRLKVYRNDSTQTQLKFVPVERAMGIDKVGSWMGFALGDYDGDSDLDVFVTNIGYHPRLRPPPFDDSADCASVQRYEWGTCDHFLLKNGGLKYSPGFGVLGSYSDVAYSIVVEPSRVLPPLSLDPTRILDSWQVPTGLAAYDFGFGAVFFDMENDGDEDLYWLGSALGRGESRLGPAFPSAGRMLRNMYRGDYQDVTVETQLLAIEGVDYSITDRKDPSFDADFQRLAFKYHENGKGVASGDLNGDGYIDLVVTNSSGEYLTPQGETIMKDGPIFVWMNPGSNRNWINLRLKGSRSIDGGRTNRDAIGARIYVTADINGENETETQVSEVAASSSFLSMSSLDQHFGLGSANKVEKVEVIWPSGISQTLYDIPINTTTLIVEPN
ncbi:MAG: FG-GAP-like repeat-containing protein, partial [Chloroflexota bacterium]|nr:FG-GAP-like repeat-containing protein [Chloroflexota bacterium]